MRYLAFAVCFCWGFAMVWANADFGTAVGVSLMIIAAEVRA